MHFFLVTRALKAEHFLQLIVEKKVRKIRSVSGTHGSTGGAEMEGPHDKGCRRPLGTEWSCTDSQQGNVSISPTTTRDWILLTTWMFLEADSPLERPVKSPDQLMPWFLLYTTLNGRDGWACMEFWPTELWDNKWMLFSAATFVDICYSGNRKLIQRYRTSKYTNFYERKRIVSKFQRQILTKL